MARMSRWVFLGCLLLTAGKVAADDLWVQAGTTQTQPVRPGQPPATPPRPAEQPAAPTPPARPGEAPRTREERPPEANRPPESALARGPTETGEVPRDVNPNMLGDFPGFCVPRLMLVPALRTTT